ncbi:hypothetical protein D9615_010108 [Tricholomella constricta]|uniref:Uncharacterized protein n=1 Tax=Tricholomella constricta TaxID=117010 RepID=A0A8H5LXA4_9AGAR|nr:hypothetical protein D9615_010108 [Tricholomella constricta]
MFNMEITSFSSLPHAEESSEDKRWTPKPPHPIFPCIGTLETNGSIHKPEADSTVKAPVEGGKEQPAGAPVFHDDNPSNNGDSATHNTHGPAEPTYHSKSSNSNKSVLFSTASTPDSYSLKSVVDKALCLAPCTPMPSAPPPSKFNEIQRNTNQAQDSSLVQGRLLRDILLPVVIKNAQRRPGFDDADEGSQVQDRLREALTDEFCESLAEKVRTIQLQMQAVTSGGTTSAFTEGQPVNLQTHGEEKGDKKFSTQILPAHTSTQARMTSAGPTLANAIPIHPVSSPLLEPPNAPRAMRLREKHKDAAFGLETLAYLLVLLLFVQVFHLQLVETTILSHTEFLYQWIHHSSQLRLLVAIAVALDLARLARPYAVVRFLAHLGQMPSVVTVPVHLLPSVAAHLFHDLDLLAVHILGTRGPSRADLTHDVAPSHGLALLPVVTVGYLDHVIHAPAEHIHLFSVTDHLPLNGVLYPFGVLLYISAQSPGPITHYRLNIDHLRPADVNRTLRALPLPRVAGSAHSLHHSVADSVHLQHPPPLHVVATDIDCLALRMGIIHKLTSALSFLGHYHLRCHIDPPKVKSEPDTEDYAVALRPLSSSASQRLPKPTFPCHSVPGVWLVRTGHDGAHVLDSDFEVDAETAKKWNLSGFSLSRDTSAIKLSLQLLCLPRDLVPNVYETSLALVTAEDTATALSKIKTEWPPQGSLIVQMNPAERHGRTWLPTHMGPVSPPLDLTDSLCEGPNVVRLIQLDDMADKIFVLHAATTPPKKQASGGGLQKCWDIAPFDLSLGAPAWRLPTTIEVTQLEHRQAGSDGSPACLI